MVQTSLLFWISWTDQIPAPLYGITSLLAQWTRTWLDYYPCTIDPNLIPLCDLPQVIVHHATQGKFYYSMDEGVTWSKRILSPPSLNPRSLLWNPVNDRMAVAHDSQHNNVTKKLL